MVKYHINSKNEVKPCGAKIKCRVKGGAGVHFESLEAAEEYIATQAAGESDILSSHSKNPRTSSVAVAQEQINVQLGERAKKSVQKFKDKGFEVNTAEAVDGIPSNSESTMFDISQIDIIDTPKLESPFDELIEKYGVPFHAKQS